MECCEPGKVISYKENEAGSPKRVHFSISEVKATSEYVQKKWS